MIYKGFIKACGAIKTALFPLAVNATGRCGSILSPCLGGFFLLLQTQAQASETATTQIDRSIAAHVAQQVSHEAHQQGWQRVRHSLSITHVGNSDALSSCTRPLRITPAAAPAPGARQRLQVTCSDSPGWSHSVMAQASIYLSAVHAATQLDRGSTLHSSQLKLAETELGKTNRGYFQSLEEVSGQGAKRRIRAGQLITPSLLSAPLTIRRGEAVSIRASQDGISASTKGQALSNGRADEVIRVRNLSSEKVIDAQVVGPGVVTSTFR